MCGQVTELHNTDLMIASAPPMLRGEFERRLTEFAFCTTTLRLTETAQSFAAELERRPAAEESV